MVSTIKVLPDGGYGWVIVLANAMSNILIIPLMQTFGLIFKDTFVEMGLSATQGSLIINLNAAFGMIMGMVNGFLLKMFGYRKIALMASFLVTTGVILTSFATTFTHFMITYGLITSLGMGMNMAAYGLALNSYFRKNRGKAVGYAMTITGLGPILMPQLINGLSKMYTVQGTTLILGAISAHSFISALLLHPLKWHMKTEIVEDGKLDPIEEDPPEQNEGKTETRIKLIRSTSQVARSRKNSMMGSTESLDEVENGPIYGMDSALAGSVISLHSMNRKASVVSQSKKSSKIGEPTIKTKSSWRLFLDRLVKFFDLDLLKDPIYVSIMVGLSLAVFAEINFSLLTAFILAEFSLNTEQIATFMSILGIADIIFRFLAPYIGQLMKLPPRPMYVITLFLLILSRFSLLISNNYIILLGVALGLGIAKGVRTVYMRLVVPAYVPIEKLASASGLQMMVNGFCILLGGPVIGMIRDVTGNYIMCIVVLNCVTLSTIAIWSIEAITTRFKKKQRVQDKSVEQTDTLLNKS
jgi:MFS family permease